MRHDIYNANLSFDIAIFKSIKAYGFVYNAQVINNIWKKINLIIETQSISVNYFILLSNQSIKVKP